MEQKAAELEGLPSGSDPVLQSHALSNEADAVM
jgi:hypothetical protein